VVVGAAGTWRITAGEGGLIRAGELIAAISKWPVRVTSIEITGSAVALEGDYVFIGGL
jgi:hypothetical protein